MPVTDSMFLLIESREHPMHVGGLQLFRKPEGAGDDYVAQLYRDLIDKSEVRPLFRQRPAGPVNSLGQLAWTEDTELDLSYHVRRSALPTPGRVRELLEITSRWHGTLLDRHRPLWETHFIEGLNDGRFAISCSLVPCRASLAPTMMNCLPSLFRPVLPALGALSFSREKLSIEAGFAARLTT